MPRPKPVPECANRPPAAGCAPASTTTQALREAGCGRGWTKALAGLAERCACSGWSSPTHLLACEHARALRGYAKCGQHSLRAFLLPNRQAERAVPASRASVGIAAQMAVWRAFGRRTAVWWVQSTPSLAAASGVRCAPYRAPHRRRAPVGPSAPGLGQAPPVRVKRPGLGPASPILVAQEAGETGPLVETGCGVAASA